MRCKRHTVDFTSTIGVCASCLRERLLSLAASAAATAAVKSNNNRRFIAPPQVELGYSDFESNRILKSKEGKCSNLFRTRSEEFNSNSRFSTDATESSSRSFVSTILHGGRRKKQQATACCVEDVIAGRKPRWIFCGGMSPARYKEKENEHESTSETMEESPGRLRKPPATRTPGRRKIGFRLSPLVRANPNCSLQRKIRIPSEFGNSGKIMQSEKPEAASFCTNRSKKLVDLGRVDRRR